MIESIIQTISHTVGLSVIERRTVRGLDTNNKLTKRVDLVLERKYQTSWRVAQTISTLSSRTYWNITIVTIENLVVI